MTARAGRRLLISLCLAIAGAALIPAVSSAATLVVNGGDYDYDAAAGQVNKLTVSAATAAPNMMLTTTPASARDG